jgi:uncharacterized membrane protein YfcA
VSTFAFFISVLLASIVAGMLGSMLGLGGGIIVVPFLTLAFGINIRLAIGASIIAVVATSSGAASAYVRERLTNLRVAMALEVATVTGALTGAAIGGLISVSLLSIVFGIVLIIAAAGMLRRRADRNDEVPPSRLADKLRLHSAYYDPARGEVVRYRVTHVPAGAVMMYVAGAASGLLGIGGGVFKVPAMDLAMRLPVKVSTTTSNFMIGVTAAASAAIYFGRGDIDPLIAGPVAVGTLLGARAGAKLLPKLSGGLVRMLFVIVLVLVGLEMLRQGI